MLYLDESRYLVRPSRFDVSKAPVLLANIASVVQYANSSFHVVLNGREFSR